MTCNILVKHASKFTFLVCLALGSIYLPSSGYAASSLSDAQLSVLDDLAAAEQQLNITERRISNERTALANTLSQAEQNIQHLQ